MVFRYLLIVAENIMPGVSYPVEFQLTFLMSYMIGESNWDLQNKDGMLIFRATGAIFFTKVSIQQKESVIFTKVSIQQKENTHQ